MAPVENRLTIVSTGSTSSIGTGWRAVAVELEQAAQRGQLAWTWSSTSRRVLLEDVVPLGAGGVLELEHGLGVEQVVLALAAPLVLAAELELAVGPLLGRSGRRCGGGPATSSAISSRPMPPSCDDGAGEVLVDHVVSRGRSPRRSARRVYEATVEMPIFDITLSTPLPDALM